MIKRITYSVIVLLLISMPVETATFTTPGYPGTVTGKATKTVSKAEGYSGTITVTKTWDYKKQDGNSESTFSGSQIVTFSGTFTPNSQMEGMEGQPLQMFVASSVTGTWKHNEDRYCEGPGCGKCQGLVYQEYGSGNVPSETLKGLIIIINVFPTDNKEVANQMAKFGMVNWYDIATPTETVPTQSRTKYDAGAAGCQWSNSATTTVLTGSDVRYKLKDLKTLQGKASWSSEKESTGISTTNMTEAIYDQKPYDPEKDGSDFTYTITWNLKAF